AVAIHANRGVFATASSAVANAASSATKNSPGSNHCSLETRIPAAKHSTAKRDGAAKRRKCPSRQKRDCVLAAEAETGIAAVTIRAAHHSAAQLFEREHGDRFQVERLREKIDHVQGSEVIAGV